MGPTGTVRAVVRYATGSGSQPLPGVEVFLGVLDPFSALYACTDAQGVATFTEVPANTDLISGTGVSLSPLRETCTTNPEFLNPDTGRQMTDVAWRNHHGISTFDTFVVGEGETFTVRFVARTPERQARICAGSWATWVGTSGSDRYVGTAGVDVIQASGGADVIDGVGGDDEICGGRGNDVVRGGRGTDWIFGGPGVDELVGGPGANVLVGGPGQDSCEGGSTYDCE
jgi:Ca2+-binding RTX toxin-like protein